MSKPKDTYARSLISNFPEANGDGSQVRYQVQLVQTRPNYGGVRWWFICPRSGRRVAKLFLPLGGSQFWSRKAYGLGYACQRLAPTDRVHLQGCKVYRAPGGEDDWQDEYPEKPKWMRRHLQTQDRATDTVPAVEPAPAHTQVAALAAFAAAADRRKGVCCRIRLAVGLLADRLL